MSIRIIGIEQVLSHLDSYKNSLDSKLHRLCEKLAEIGVDIARSGFESAQYDGINDVEVNAPVWESENKLVIYATGNAVAFIEFGTGVHYSEEHPKAAELGAIRGSYGKGKGSNEYWGYYGSAGTNGEIVRTTQTKGNVVLTQGNPPARAMFNSAEEMKAKIVEIAKEVFGE